MPASWRHCGSIWSPSWSPQTTRACQIHSRHGKSITPCVRSLSTSTFTSPLSEHIDTYNAVHLRPSAFGYPDCISYTSTWGVNLSTPCSKGVSDRLKLSLRCCQTLMHALLVIWTESKYYNTSSRLVPLLQLIMDHLIAQTLNFVPGEANIVLQSCLLWLLHAARGVKKVLWAKSNCPVESQSLHIAPQPRPSDHLC